jgi:enoyl-CoA hydratase/carnithine racemase
MEKNFETIQWSFNEATGIGHVVLDRPNTLNSLSMQLKEDLLAGFQAFGALDDESAGVTVRVVVVEGEGEKAFCAGADVTEMSETTPRMFDPSEIYDVCEQFNAPVVAKIDGHCLGGGLEFALSCDFRIASERSTLGQPEVDLGIIPGGGGTQRLVELVGPARTKELCMTGQKIDANQAAADGIVDHVYPAAELDDQVTEFAETLASKPPLSVRAVKDVVTMSQQTGLREGRLYEVRTVNELRHTEDHKESVAAFDEDRDPEWQGK